MLAAWLQGWQRWPVGCLIQTENILATIRSIAMKFGTGIRGAERINAINYPYSAAVQLTLVAQSSLAY